jgi:hypothetical protein
MADLRIAIDSFELTGTWTDSNPRTREAIAEGIPISGNATRWGDELYFRTEIDVPAENAQTTVPAGALAYWPQGNALCLFWGPTPASDGDEPRAAAPVNVVAELDDIGPLSQLDGGATVRIEQA